MNSSRHITDIAVAILLLASLVLIHQVHAEDCYLDTNDDGVGDSTAGAESDGDDEQLACGRGATATGVNSTAVGYSATAPNPRTTAIGHDADALGWYSTAVGASADATGHNSVAVGDIASATQNGATAVGAGSDASEGDATAIGAASDAASEGSTVLGFAANIQSTDARIAIALGYAAKVTGTAPGAIAIGGDSVDGDYDGALASAENAIAIGADAIASVANTVILGSPYATTKVGINTSTPSNELDIRSGSPAIRLDDNGTDQGRVDLDMSDNEFAIQGNSNQEIVEIDTRAPSHALTIVSTGDVGVGTQSPVADLHIRGEGSGTSEELLRLESSTKPQIKIMNSSTGRNWILGMNAQNDLILYANETGKTSAKFRGNGNLIIAGTLTENSDRNSKRAIKPVDSKQILAAVAKLPVSTWEYKREEGVKHLGPMAQDFHAAFGLGDDPKGISSIDTGGVALAAIKGLNEIVQAKDKEIAAQNKKISYQNEKIISLQERLTMLENLVNKMTAKEVVMYQ